MKTPQKCRTVVIEDSPSPTDLFAPQGEMGPHKRVAEAISELILTNDEPGGKMIGLEGGWGSGKSTVINLIKSKIQSTSKDVEFLSFDAWAHEGDPLRRTYLEAMIMHFTAKKWINEKNWEKKLEELANRRKTTETHNVSRPTSLGTWFAVSLLLVPIASPVLRAGLEDGLTVSAGGEFNVKFLVGLLLCAAPFIVILWNWIRRSDRDAEKWAFISGNSKIETRQESIETPEPTSIEFENCFRELMNEALSSSTGRKAVIVLDNLDRIDAKFTLSIWSTLQTFLQDRSAMNEEWYKKIWILIPYDPSGLRQVWASQTSENNDGEINTFVADSFIDKSFQLRFEVPPLVLSNWKHFLIELLKQGLPDHKEDEESLTRVFRIYNASRKEKERSPTPRELKLFVNQVGSIHRQWGDTYPLSHVAYYVMLKRQQTDVAKQLLAGDIPLPTIESLVEPGLKATLAGLVFNVSAKVGEQLLLSGPIMRALSSGEDRNLVQLRDNHGEGFWAVLDEIGTTGLRDADILTVANAAKCINASKLTISDRRAEVLNFVKAFETAILGFDRWTVNSPIALGISALIEMTPSTDLINQSLKKIEISLADMKSTDASGPVVSDTVQGVFMIFDAIEKVGQGALLTKQILVPIEALAWINLASSFNAIDGQYWHLVRPQDESIVIGEVLGSLVDSGQFNENHIRAIDVTQQSFKGEANWTAFGSAIEKRLTAGSNIQHPEVPILIRSLYVLKHHNWNTADEILLRLAQNGHLCHLLFVVDPKNKQIIPANLWCIVAFLDQKPDATVPKPVGNSSQGHANLLSLLAKDDDDLAEDLTELLYQEEMSSLLFKVVDARTTYDPLVVACLKKVVTLEGFSQVFTSEQVVSRWAPLKKYLPQPLYSTLLGNMSRETTLLDDISNADFDVAHCEFYADLMDQSNSSVFEAWCDSGLTALTRDEWLPQLKPLGSALRLSKVLHDKAKLTNFKTAFQDPLHDFALEVMRSAVEIPENSVQAYKEIINFLEPSIRNVLQERLLEKAINADGNISDTFFEIYGAEISGAVLKEDHVVRKLFSSLLRTKPSKGLLWLESVLSAHPDLNWYSSDADGITDFLDRLQIEVNKEDSDVNPIISRIAGRLGIVKKSPDNAKEE